MEKLFTTEINGWDAWGDMFQSIAAFEPLAMHILESHKLPRVELTHLSPGTNGVFRSGDYVVKMFAPISSGLDTEQDYIMELAGMDHAAKRGVRIPNVVARGEIEDKYLFRYIVMDFVQGNSFAPEHVNTLTEEERFEIGRKLRNITDALDTEPDDISAFKRIDIFEREQTNPRWNIFTDGFNAERLAFIETMRHETRVLVHGDINNDNLLLTPDKEICILDFADACFAPPDYELPPVVFDTMHFDTAFLRGYVSKDGMDAETLAERCLRGVMMHDFGADIIRQCLCVPALAGSIEDVREALLNKIKF